MRIIGIHKETKKMIYIDTGWMGGNAYCACFALDYDPFIEFKGEGVFRDNRFGIDPTDYDWQPEMSPYMPAHCNYNSDCCGIFMYFEDGKIYCNECGMELNKFIEKLRADAFAEGVQHYAEHHLE